MPTGYETAAAVVQDAQAVDKAKLHPYLAAVERAALKRHGGVADGVTDNLPKFQAARAAAGPNGIVTLDGSGTYAMAGARPDLTGVHIAADPGVVLKVDENPNTMAMRLLTPLTVENPVHGTVQVKPRNVGLDRECHMLGAAAAAAMAGRNKQVALLDFTAAAPNGWTNYALADPATFTAGTATVAPQTVLQHYCHRPAAPYPHPVRAGGLSRRRRERAHRSNRPGLAAGAACFFGAFRRT